MTDVIGRAKIIVTSEVDSRSADQAGSAMGDFLGKSLKRTAVGAAAGIGTLIGTTLFKGFQRLSSIDDAQAKLRGLGNSAGDVKKAMVNALAAVKGTAFGLGDAATVAAQLIAAGAKPGKELEAQLKTVANTAAAAGISLEEMGSIYAKAMTQANGVQNDVLGQLQDRGIPIYQKLGEQLGVTAGAVFDLAKDGKISFDQFAKAAKDASGRVAWEMGQTVSGSLSNAGAALGRLGAAFLGPGFKDAPDLFNAIGRAADRMVPKAAAFAAKIQEIVNSDTAQKLLDLAKLLNNTGVTPTGTGSVLTPDAKPPTGVFDQPSIEQGARDSATGAWGVWLAQWKENSEDTGSDLAEFLRKAFGEDKFTRKDWGVFSSLEQAGEDAGGRLHDMWDDMVAYLRGKWDGFSDYFSDKWHTITSGVKNFGKEIKTAWNEDVASLKEKWNGFTGWLSGTLSKIGDKFRDMWDGIRSAGQSAFSALKSALNSVINGMNNAIDVFNAIPKVPNVDHIPTLKAAGGPASGLTIINERGPELVSLPNGSYVHNANDTKQMLANSSGDVHFNITTTGPVSESLLAEINWLGKFGTFGAVSVGA